MPLGMRVIALKIWKSKLFTWLHFLSFTEVFKRIDPSSRLGVFRNRLRAALEIQHMAAFFRANAHFQIKSNEEMTDPDSPEFQALEKLETEGYEEAKRLRQEILQEVRSHLQDRQRDGMPRTG